MSLLGNKYLICRLCINKFAAFLYLYIIHIIIIKDFNDFKDFIILVENTRLEINLDR
jgi:hypothetical protein